MSTRSTPDPWSEHPGLGTLAQASVIVAVFAIVLVGMVVLTERQEAVDRYAAASAQAETAAERAEAEADRRAAEAAEGEARSPTPVPAPDAAGPGTYTVQRGDSLFSVAADLGLSPNELVYWNKDTYPTLQSTPALTPGWVLATTGPPLPTASPRPTPTPRPIAPATPPPQAAGLPSFGPASFPASESVSVATYAVFGSTPAEIYRSMDDNGPYSEWIGQNAVAHVEVRTSFNFSFRGDGAAGCEIVPTGGEFVTMTYHVVIPAWQPPADVSSGTVDWWIEQIHETVAHEGHHITLWEGYRPRMNDAVANGTCASVEDDLVQIMADARRVNCEFDLAEYAAALGMTLESCLGP